MVILAEIESEKGKIHVRGRKLEKRGKKTNKKERWKALKRKAKKYCEGKGTGRKEREENDKS